MNRLAVIPARGGSKRLPRKNIVDFMGKPLLAHTVDAALRSQCFARVLVSTDDEEIADVARAAGADVPFLRDRHADDHASAGQATTYAWECYERATGEQFDVVCQLMPNCPLRDADDVRRALAYFEEHGAPFQISVFRFGWMNPWWAMKLDAEGRPSPMFAAALEARSQDLPPLVCPTGAIWVARAQALEQVRDFYGPDHRAFVLDWLSALDIDDADDLAMARAAWHLRHG